MFQSSSGGRTVRSVERVFFKNFLFFLLECFPLFLTQVCSYLFRYILFCVKGDIVKSFPGENIFKRRLRADPDRSWMADDTLEGFRQLQE